MARTPIPGEDAMRDLIKDAAQPIAVFDVKPIDVSYIQDTGMRAVVALAASLQWNVLHKANKMVTLIARDGFKHVIPTNTSIKFSVFLNRMNATLTHSVTHVPTPELMEKLIKQYKLDPSHARVFKAAGGNGVVEGLDEPDEHLPRRTAAIPDLPDEKLFVPTERMEPTLNFAKEGEQYISEIMDTIIRRLVADGDDQITYRCKVCGLEFETKRGVGAHWQVHTKAGEAEATAGNKRVIVNKVPDYVPTEVHTPRKDMAQEMRRLRRIVQDVQRAVGQQAIREADQRVMVAERRVEMVTKERDEAVARAERLASDLRSLRELIGGISDE